MILGLKGSLATKLGRGGGGGVSELLAAGGGEDRDEEDTAILNEENSGQPVQNLMPHLY